jgi:hypothetical protein
LLTIGMLPHSLLALLDAHVTSHSPRYAPHDHSDHGPMAYLAMHGLGLPPHQIERFARGYRQRLSPLAAPRERLRRDSWHLAIGDAGAYPELLQYFAADVSENGWQRTLLRHLPSVASGWVKDLFHPVIRLAYGIEFVIPAEIAAGLAYLASAGDDPRLAVAARLPPARLDAGSYLRQLQGRRRGSVDGLGPFNARYRRVLESMPPKPLAATQGGVFADLTRACLEVFDATHDFFALHLVTGSHAFRVCSPWIGRDAEGLFSAGLSVAYAALGAPPFPGPERRSEARLDVSALVRATDEHDLKLAYSCLTLARSDADPSYEDVAERYLAPRIDALDASAESPG